MWKLITEEVPVEGPLILFMFKEKDMTYTGYRRGGK